MTHRRSAATHERATLESGEICTSHWTIRPVLNCVIDSHDRPDWRRRLLATRGRQIHIASVERNDRCAIAILDAAGIVIAWHDDMPCAQPYDFGVLSHHMSQFYLPDDVALHVPARHLSIAAEYGVDTQRGWRRRPGGEVFWGVTVMQSILLSNGELLGYSHVTRSARGPAPQLARQSRTGLSQAAHLALMAQ